MYSRKTVNTLLEVKPGIGIKKRKIYIKVDG